MRIKDGMCGVDPRKGNFSFADPENCQRPTNVTVCPRYFSEPAIPMGSSRKSPIGSLIAEIDEEQEARSPLERQARRDAFKDF